MTEQATIQKTGTYLFADIAVEVTSLFDEVHQMCQAYRTEKAPEVRVKVSADMVDFEAVESRRQLQAEGLPPYEYPKPYLETLAVYRQIAQAFVARGILLIHGSVIAVDGQAYLFTARSGTGKSTHVRLWRTLFGSRAVMINDDKPLIRVADAMAFGTPWDGKHHLSNNIAAPLKAIIRLERGAENHIEPVAPVEMIETLLQQTYRDQDAATTIGVLQLISLLTEKVKFYRLHCNMHPDAARVAYEGMR